MSLIHKKTTHELGANSASPAVGPSSHRLLRKSEFYRMLDKAVWEQGTIGQEVGDLLRRPAGPTF